MEKIHTATHEISIDNQGIVLIKVLEGAHIELHSLKELNEHAYKLSGNKKPLALVDARSFHTMTPEATAYLKKNFTTSGRLATAIVSEKVGIRLVVDFINSAKKITSPVRLFSNEEDARKWLLLLKHKK